MKKFYSLGDNLIKEISRFYGDKITYGKIMKLLREKDVKVNGGRVNKDVKTQKGDEITVYYDGEDKKIEIKVLYKDDNILVAYKPKGVTSEDFYNAVKEKYESAIFTHRLDRNTDGITLFALNDIAYGELFDGLKNRTFDKRYTATVYGVMPKRKDRLTAYLKKDEKAAKVEISATPKKGYEKIITDYEVLSCDGETSVLRVGLITGKTHQIRAHLAFTGHFIIGDGKYGKEEMNRRYKAKYQLLTATEITLKFAGNSPLYYLNDKKFTIEGTI